jgi:hypothetical protein
MLLQISIYGSASACVYDDAFAFGAALVPTPVPAPLAWLPYFRLRFCLGFGRPWFLVPFPWFLFPVPQILWFKGWVTRLGKPPTAIT